MENRVKYFIVSVSNVTGGLFFLQVDSFFSGWTSFSRGGLLFLKVDAFFYAFLRYLVPKTLPWYLKPQFGTQNLAVVHKTLLWNTKPYIGTQNLGVFYKKYRKSSSIKGKQISFRPFSSLFPSNKKKTSGKLAEKIQTHPPPPVLQQNLIPFFCFKNMCNKKAQ